MEGLTLKNWRLGEKIGAGACSDVYAVEPLKPVSGNRGARFVMKLSRIPEVPAAKAKNKKRKKTPAERNADALYAEYLVYQSCLRDHARVPRLPDGAYGEDKGYRFLVLERLGRTLESVLQDEGPIPSATAARLGLEILDTVQHMHVNNVIYVDIKPENFMVDADTESKVYCLDFGISDRYVMATGKHKELKVGAVVGTPTFLSANCHAGATPSRRDDIEALLHVLLYLQLGSLPWQRATSDAAGAKLKKAMAPSELCRGLPREWALMLEQIRACGFEDKPDYTFFVAQLRKLGGVLGATTPFDWGVKSGKESSTVSKGTVTPSASPTSKRAKSEREAPAPQQQQQRQQSSSKKSASAPAAKSKRATRAAAKPKPRASSRSRATKQQGGDDDDDDKEVSEANSSDGNDDDDDYSDGDNDVEDDKPRVVKTVAKGPGRKEMATRLAVAAHAAATGAMKNAERASTRKLRSSSRSSL